MAEYRLTNLIKRKNMFSVEVTDEETNEPRKFDVELSAPKAVELDPIARKLNKVLDVSQYRHKRIKVFVENNKIVDVKIPSS